VAGGSGIGGRIKSEWVAGYFRNQWPDDPGIRTVTADGAYDTRKCHNAIADRGAAAIIAHSGVIRSGIPI
jgi:hypothetical protein